MKYLLIVTSLVLFSCLSKNESEDTKTSEEIIAENLKNKTYQVPEFLLGKYISAEYLDKLRETKSTKLSQEVSPVSLLTISNKNGKYIANTIWNFHEGTEDNFKMLSNESAIISSVTDSGTNPNLIIGKDGIVFMIVDQKTHKLIKINNNGENPEKLVIHKTLFEGKYSLNGKRVQLTKEGKIIGIDSLYAYEVNIDYIDAGMDFDKIYLTTKGKEKQNGLGEAFGYEFINNNLEIFRLNCLEYEPGDPEFCIKHSKGETVYKLVKQ